MVSFTLQERRALLLLFSLAAFYFLMDFLPQKKNRTYALCLDDMVGFQEQVQVKSKDVAASIRVDKNTPAKSETQQLKSSTRKKEYFSFDPNSVSLDSLQLLGFSKKVSERWIKFRKKGKVYSDLNDLQSIYGIDSNRLDDLTAYISFPEKTYPKKKLSIISKADLDFDEEQDYDQPIALGMQKLDLNLCDKEDLRALGGIGKIYASRILKYRDLLGGYASVGQLREVYGLSDSTFQVIKDFVTVETPPNRIKINTQSLDELSANFLIRHKPAKIIHAYRTEHGPFVDKQDFKKVKGLKKDFVEQILPYLDFAL